MAVRHEHILPPVEVVVEEERREGQREQAVPADLRDRRLVYEEAQPLVAVERDHLVREVADHQVREPVPVVVRGVDAHGAARRPVLGEGDPGDHAGVLEPPAPQVPVEVVRLGVVRHGQVREVVAVVVEDRRAEPLAARVRQTGRAGDVGETVGAVVPVEDGARALVGLRRAVTLVLPVERAEDVLLDRPLHIVQHEEVEVAVRVGVEPDRPRGEPRVRHRLRFRGRPEPAVAVVREQPVRSERGQIDILVAVPVVVGGGGAQTVERLVEPGTGGRVLEGPVPPVPVEGRCRRLPLPVAGPASAVHEEEVRVAVPVGVEEDHPAPHRLRQVLLPEGPVLVDERDPGLLRDLHEPRLRGASDRRR